MRVAVLVGWGQWKLWQHLGYSGGPGGQIHVFLAFHQSLLALQPLLGSFLLLTLQPLHLLGPHPVPQSLLLWGQDLS